MTPPRSLAVRRLVPAQGPLDASTPAAPWLAQLAGSRSASVAAALGVAAACVLPPQGLGIPLCQFRLWTGLPCPGCGLTRSIIGTAHLDLSRALQLHPLGPVLFLGMLALAGLLLLPAGNRHDFCGWLGARPALSRVAGWSLAGFMVIYGAARLLCLLTTLGGGPW